jgi:hypothetical protein
MHLLCNVVLTFDWLLLAGLQASAGCAEGMHCNRWLRCIHLQRKVRLLKDKVRHHHILAPSPAAADVLCIT